MEKDNKNNKNYYFLKTAIFIRYLGDALFYAFFQVFLVYKGLSESSIGLIMSITPIVALVCNPFWNFLCKDVNVNRKIMRIITIFEGIFIIIIGRVSGVILYAILTGLIAIVGTPFYSLLDGFSGTFAETYNKKYSKMRIMGSIAYIIGTAIGGVIIDKIGFEYLFLSSGILMILTSIVLRTIKPIELSKNPNGKKIKRDYKGLLLNKNFIFYIFIYVFTITISYIGDNFIGVYLRNERMLSNSQFGFVTSSIIIVEVVTMFICSKWLENKNPRFMLIICGFSYFFRSLFIAVNLPTPLILVAALLRGFSVGLLLCYHIKVLIKIVKVENLTTSIFILAIVQSIVQIFGNYSFGMLIEKTSFEVFYFILAISALIGTLSHLFYYFIEKNKMKVLS